MYSFPCARAPRSKSTSLFSEFLVRAAKASGYLQLKRGGYWKVGDVPLLPPDIQLI